ncbi:hypothetical protein ATCC90586_000501 [Pythium insidiosum]|nr:hypothetical protein ATCC90586_000501 [Pythium insidiosum]
MLPVSVSLRRVAARYAPGVIARGRSLHARHAGAAVTQLLVAQRQSALPTARFASTSALADDDELTEVVLEPLPSLSKGFVGQKDIGDFDMSETLRANLVNAGITHLFPVQAQSFDVMMKGADIVGRSKTGSGKTLAFGLPIVDKLLTEQSSSRDPRALILLPTRELAQQVADEIKRVSPQLRTINVVGGVSYTLQENQLRRGADILVGTPGRIMDLVDKGSLSLNQVKVSVLDEADMMLKFGFQEAVETILGWIPGDRQCVMWSATFPKWVNAMAKKFTKSPVSIDLVGDADNHVPTTVSHKAIHAPIRSRTQILENVLRHHARGGQTLIFTETKQEADEIANSLGGDVRALHGDLSQGMRSSTMDGFRNGSIKTLVCTDIAARGLDIANVELVVQFRLPGDKESFVHRAGRTGRAGRSGTNIVFFDRADVGDVRDFEKRYKFKFQHAAPPQIQHVMDAAVAEATKKLADVPTESKKLFEEAAVRLYKEQGVDAISSALAVLCGLDNEHLNAFSMLSGRAKLQTVEIDGATSAREIVELLTPFDRRLSVRDVHELDGKFVLDIHQDSMERLREHLAAEKADHITVSPVVELSRLLIANNASSESRGRNDRRGNNGRRFGGADDRSFSGRSSGRGGNLGRSFDFDAPFSRGGRGEDRNRKGGRTFGRVSSEDSRSRFGGKKDRRSSGGFRDSW